MPHRRIEPDVCRLLVVEDCDERISRFREWILPPFRPTFVRSAGRALKVLELDGDRTFAGILLDHDLDQSVAMALEQQLSGLQVVERLVHRVDRDVPILIHSVNPPGARRMARCLLDHGFDVTRIPFDALTRARLRRWLEVVREEWEANF
ncbi:hypothetical protein HFP89_01820 [Wenzhouxiangella sp. XN79A]|uniref:cyclic-phosphate processing receiver domain-containing protein n=1 Tax=Wenzhouxiangella sp. XN79A TaxID=2724193 RepID=UPI00144AB88B|nr:cyclic-phosphate processing receiver domain-containing protein [Wenzhouxiangella sp. XN79A]NKI33901.1 hypothetical protein [Wenzhouxiangella sp. XN79A]